MNVKPAVVLFLTVLLAAAAGLDAQRGAQPQPPQTPRAAAPIDLTGFWVSLVTNEWRWRMLAPTKGDYAVLPLNAEGRRIADTWDPDRDEASGNQCRSYGAAVIMQVPGRLRIAWEKDDVLRMDIDAGTQTRLFQFGQIAAARRSTDVAGRVRRPVAGGTRPGPGGARTAISSAQRDAEGRDDTHAPRISPQKRRAIQRRRHRHRVLRSLLRQRYRLPQRHRHR